MMTLRDTEKVKERERESAKEKDTELMIGKVRKKERKKDGQGIVILTDKAR